MNLFFNPSLKEFRKLLSKCDQSTDIHNIVIDYDGEVIVDPEVMLPKVDLNKFKFRMQLYKPAKTYLSNTSFQLQVLFHNLLKGWEGDSENYTTVAFS